jgi:SAM-dependent methyltransferase
MEAVQCSAGDNRRMTTGVAPAGASRRPPELINFRVYHSRKVLSSYRDNTLTPMEAAALLKYQAGFFARDVLDVGVGTGRTSRYLVPLARHYLGIDYSPVMLARLAVTMPQVPVRRLDMCDLSALGSASFDFVFAPNNVLDAVSHGLRLRALCEWQRVLRPGGLLIFSAHNRHYRHALRGPRLAAARNPVTQLCQLLRFARCWCNFARLAGERMQTGEFALLTDSGHDYACLHYYIGRCAQHAQLHACGLQCIDTLNHLGDPAGSDADVSDSPSLMYIARKPAAAAARLTAAAPAQVPR